MNAKLNRFLNARSGQSLVEFALVLPLLVVVIFIITEFGRALHEHNLLTQATREGARRAVVSGADNAETKGEQVIAAFLDSAGMDPARVTIDCEVFTDEDVPMVRATAEMPFDWVLGDVPLPTTTNGSNTISKGGITLRGETIMQGEW